MRRWTAGTSHDFDGITVAIRPGHKSPDDLALWLCVNGRWFEPRMEFALALVDFFAENERALAKHRPFWKFNGDAYFLQAVGDAVRFGWKRPAARIRADRRMKDGAA